MIFGAKEEIIPKYYDDDKPKSVQKTSFGLVRIILLWLASLLFNKKGVVTDNTFFCERYKTVAYTPSATQTAPSSPFAVVIFTAL